MAQTDVLDYIRQTPHNSNVNVVKGMLNSIDSDGNSEPLIVTAVSAGEGRYDLDKTFGEIRQALESGRCVKLDATSMNGTVSNIVGFKYHVDEYGAGGEVDDVFYHSFEAYLTEPPYTLEALDAEYPYVSD